jgi:hypothetical protein
VQCIDAFVRICCTHHTHQLTQSLTHSLLHHYITPHTSIPTTSSFTDMKSSSWSCLFEKYSLFDPSDAELLDLSSPDFIFLVKDLIELRDDMSCSLEEAGAVARRLRSLECWGGGGRGGGGRVQKIRAEKFIEVSEGGRECVRECVSECVREGGRERVYSE